ncbi:response regulator [Actinoplanes sp. N902-109]|uniref:response regulator n=1 Tax=Actinoplanes sp. (strain N902-109) TaxID=649831 RepID=UPI0018DE00C0|nr:response regulator [Actinoplanes sp. N902-109]
MLIVEDDPDVRELMAFTLDQRGFATLAADGQVAAQALCRERAGRIDILIADLSLPGEVPGGLARWVATTYPKVKIVYVSGIPRHVALSSGLVQPTAPYLEKPVSPAVLASTLTSLLPRAQAAPEDW